MAGASPLEFSGSELAAPVGVQDAAGDVTTANGGVVERDIRPDEFSRASEAFLTSTTRDAMAISGVDSWADGAHTHLDLPAAPGPVTAAMAAAFRHLCATTPDP